MNADKKDWKDVLKRVKSMNLDELKKFDNEYKRYQSEIKSGQVRFPTS